MAWKNRYRRASFRGAAFHVESHAYNGGRRVAVHEFPGGEASIVEDLGLKAGEFTVEAFVLGADYDKRRNALRAALEKPGVGLLEHPYLGRLRAQVSTVALRESSGEGGVARFAITFVRADLPTPALLPNTSRLLSALADNSVADAISAFGDAMDVLAMPADVAAALQGNLKDILSAAEGVVGGIASNAAALIRAPFNMATLIAGSLHRILSLLGAPERAFNLYSQLWAADAKTAGKFQLPTPPGTPEAPLPATKRLQRQELNRRAMRDLVRRIALAEAARALSAVVFTSSTQARALRDALADALDAEMTLAPDPIYASLRALRTGMIADVTARGGSLVPAVSYTPPATLPALVIAQRLYGDATRADDIIARNAIAHPLFVTGGQALEVLGA
jgi:prophage DNA circulation protein